MLNAKMKENSMYRLYLLFFAFMLSTISFAQADLAVKSMSLTTSHIPAADKRNDYNKKPCALVKIQVVDEVERIEGYSMGKPVKKSGVEHWAYMCSGSKSMKIHFRNHLPVEVKFRDYQIESLEGNRVYELVLQDLNGRSVSENAKTLQKLILRYSPANATVLIDNVPRYGHEGRIELELPVNEEHKYLITAEGYNYVQGSVTLSSSAPRIITETLVSTNQNMQRYDSSVNTPHESSSINGNSRGEKKSFMNRLKAIGEKVKRQKQVKAKPEKRVKEEQEQIKPEKHESDKKVNTKPQKRKKHSAYSPPQEVERANTANDSPNQSSSVVPPTPLDKSFETNYNGVIFDCKAKKGYITITGFKVDADNVTIPSTVEYNGMVYPVTEINTYKNGYNYNARTIIIQEGIKEISPYCFNEFRSIVEVTIPNTIVKIGRYAFRNPKYINFHAPSYVDIESIKEGKSFEY